MENWDDSATRQISAQLSHPYRLSIKSPTPRTEAGAGPGWDSARSLLLAAVFHVFVRSVIKDV